MSLLEWVVLTVVGTALGVGIAYARASTKSDKPLPPSMNQPKEQD